MAGSEQSKPKASRNSLSVISEWVRDIKDQCAVARIAFFFKQWGGVNKKAVGNFLDGKQWLEFPELRKDLATRA